MTLDEKMAELEAAKTRYLRAVDAGTAAAARHEKDASAWVSILAEINQSHDVLSDAVRRLTVQ